MNEKPLLLAQQLAVGYGKHSVVEEIAFAARPGEILCLIAPNGAGKSTLLKTLIRQLPPLAGSLELDGQSLPAMKERDLARKSAAVFTSRFAAEWNTAEDVVSAGRYPYTGFLGVLTEEDRQIVREAMAQVGVLDLAAALFDRLSDGQRQRVLLARALAQQPQLLLMDEPTSFLDLRNKLEFLHLLRTLARERHIAVVMSLHELDLAQKFADRILCLRAGRVDRIGPPEEIFSGHYIEELFQVEHGSFDPLFASPEPAPPAGEPEIFVLGGGGAGIPVYRALQRRSLPFAAGVLQQNDLDFPVASALASEVIAEKAFEPVSEEALSRALAVLRRCRGLICCVQRFGAVNEKNRLLLEEAEKTGRLLTLQELARE